MRVIACMEDEEWDTFLAPEAPAPAGVEIERLDSAVGIDALLDALKRSAAPALLSAWSTPPLPEDLQRRLPTLRYMCHVCGTVRRIVPRTLIERGFLVSNWGPSVAPSVAEHYLTLILAGLRRLGAAHTALHGTGWNIADPVPRGLFDRRVGFHGFGAVARALVQLMAPFRCRISAFAPGDADAELTSRGVTRVADLEQLYAQSDVLACLAPLNDQTRGAVTEGLLRRLPKDALFVNVGRGGVIDESALARVAGEGRIQIALDVYQQEPLPEDSPLRRIGDAILTPHIGGPTVDRRRDCGRYALDNLAAFMRGESPRSVIDLTRYDAIT